MPWQFGPITVTLHFLASSTRRTACSLPASVSSNPALKTIALRMPFAPHSAMIPGTVCAGVMTSATSGVSGRSATDL
jgi:hypothetical protein